MTTERMHYRKKIEDLIGAYLAGEATPEEKSYLKNWINEHPENHRIFNEYETLWNLKKQKQSNKKQSFQDLTNRIHIQQKEEKHSKRKIVFLYITKVAAGVIILFSAYFLIQLLIINNSKQDSVEIITKEVPYGKKLKLQLPDGSIAHLNAGSTITYPESFSSDERNISLKGEGFFEVVELDAPFIIDVNAHRIVVLGTSFNVKTHPETGIIETVVVTGKVKFAAINMKNPSGEVYVGAGEKLQYSPTNQQIQKVKVDNFDDIAWKDGIIVFKNEALEKVFSELEKWYGVSFRISNKQILHCNLTAKFDNESLQEILDYIDVIMPLDYSLSENNNSIIIRGNGCHTFPSTRNN